MSTIEREPDIDYTPQPVEDWRVQFVKDWWRLWQKTATKADFDAVASYLTDITPQQARKALDQLVRTSKYHPKISDLLAAVETVSQPSRSGVKCEECGGSGWVHTNKPVVSNGVTYTQMVTSCRCCSRALVETRNRYARKGHER